MILIAAGSACDRVQEARTIAELTAIVRDVSAPCPAATLVEWLRESHPIYADKLPSEAEQFRGFLLARLAEFPPNEELYVYVKAELEFGIHPYMVAAAAVAARGFPDHAEELRPLLQKFTADVFPDETVDLTTPELEYPKQHPTRAKIELAKTLALFEGRRERPRKHTQRLIPIDARKSPRLAGVKLRDQDGEPFEFEDASGSPFVLTFFYTQCANSTKCVSTVQRLKALADTCEAANGIYGVTYDPAFDSPFLLKRYGSQRGLHFAENVRFLRPLDRSEHTLQRALDLRVSYGAGSVNQHGVQLFVFDKKQRLAALYDDEPWPPAEVCALLAKLSSE